MWKNSLKTMLLMTALAGLVMSFGSLLGGREGLTIACIIALIINGVMYFFSDRIVLSMYNATPLDREKHQDIYDIVYSLSREMGIPQPKLWLIATPVANAFATGRNERNSSVAFTTGIINILEPHELRGVIAHELSHIANKDILISTIAATLATIIGYLGNMVQHALIFQGGSRKNSTVGRVAGIILAAIVMPLIATLIRLAISRSREYLADERGAHACHDPLALASALQKLHSHTHEAAFSPDNGVHQATAGLFIVHPFSADSMLELLSTHPPLKKRVAALHAMHQTMQRWPV